MRYVLAVAVIVVGCGDDKPSGLQPLVADPAVELGCVPGPVGPRTRAKVVACAEELIGGRLAAGRIGDFVLENDRLRVIIRGPGEGFYLHGSSGGGIVDAASSGGEDLVKELLPAVDLAGGAFDELVIVEAGDDGPAELVVRGPATGLDIVQAALSREPPRIIIEHHYRLATGASELELETRVVPQPGTETTPHELYDALFFGGRAPAFLPAGSVGAGIIATSGTTTSYGLVHPAGTQAQLIDLAGIRLALGPDVDAAGVKRWLVVGDGSVSSVTERAWALREIELGVVSGTTAPGVEIVVLAGGAPVTIARADASGAFRAAIPPGDYMLRAEAIGRVPGPEVAITSTAGGEASTTIPAGSTGTLTISVRDGVAMPIPARVVLVPQGGGDDRIEWIGATGDATFALPPGMWRVSVTRGLEYEAFVANNVSIIDGQTTPIAASLAHVVDTAGWISLDTHLHSELSTDSTFPIDDRLRAVAAEGVEVPVSSDHDVIVDYAPIIAELGLGSWLGSLVGSETSSLIWGHINSWPLVLDPTRTGGGGVRWHTRAPGEVFDALRAGGASIVQVNHPRAGTTSLFDAIDLDPATLTGRRDPADLGLPATADLSDLSFDAVEVANGAAEFEEVFDDWLGLVAAGHPAAATGSSDSHGPSAFAGEARTYVFVGLGNDNPATADPLAIVEAIRARRVVIGTGAFVTAGIVTAAGTSLPGDTVDITGLAQVTLRIRVQAASWQPLAVVRIFEGTREVRAITLDSNDIAPVRFDADVSVPAPTASTSWVVRVDPAGPGEPVLGTPLPAFTNPVFGHVD